MSLAANGLDIHIGHPTERMAGPITQARFSRLDVAPMRRNSKTKAVTRISNPHFHFDFGRDESLDRPIWQGANRRNLDCGD